jgi:hypothetical protein
VQRHRGLRQALAWTFLEGTPPLIAPYPVCVDRFHALWEAHRSTPAEVLAQLPDSEAWSEVLADWETRFHADEELHRRALARKRQLDADARAVRQFWITVLADAGAFARTARPEPKPKSGGERR